MARQKKPVHRVQMTEGKKEVLTISVGDNESAKYWLSVMNELKNRGVKDVLIICADGLTGIKEAIAAAFPKTEYQRCIVHQVRNTLKYVPDKDRTDSKSGEHKDISFTKNCITINFHSIEEDPCFCTMFWNVHAAVKLKLSSYIGGSALIVDTNDGNRNKNISAFKMGLEAVEDIPISQHAITQKGPLVPDSLRLII